VNAGGHRAIIFEFLSQNLKTRRVAVAFSMAWLADGVEDGADGGRAYGLLAGFRQELFWCLGRRRDALFEVCDAVLCRRDRLHMLAELSLEPECRRGHGAVYDVISRAWTGFRYHNLPRGR
jgi:hypothetical protein